MPTSTLPAPQQALHDTDGRVFAYFVPAEEFENMQAELVRVRAQRDRIAAELQRVQESYAPPEPTAEDWRTFRGNSGELSALIERLETK